MSSQGAEAQPRVSFVANTAVTAILFGSALIAYGLRTYIRFSARQKFVVEDGLLLFAVLCLIGTTGLHFANLQHQYNSLAAILHANSALIVDLLPVIPEASKLGNAATTLWWFVIYLVKLAFLFFFRRLIERIRDLKIFWWFAVPYTILAGLVSIAASWLTCPYFTLREVLTCSGPTANQRVIRDTAITTAMDISTDFLVVVIPIALILRVQISLRQKLGLALSLCLSLVMVVVAVVRMAAIRLPEGQVDIVWLAFWQQQECSIAVLMISVSAFRSFFVNNASNSDLMRHQKRSWSPRMIQKYFSSDTGTTESRDELPQIPSATLTGMRTIIQGGRNSRIMPEDDPEQSMFERKNNTYQSTQGVAGVAERQD